jgi:hypothetical protein
MEKDIWDAIDDFIFFPKIKKIKKLILFLFVSIVIIVKP